MCRQIELHLICLFSGYGQETPGVFATSSSKFKIGDISKVITAMAILKLVEQGHLQLTDEVFGDLNKSM